MEYTAFISKLCLLNKAIINSVLVFFSLVSDGIVQAMMAMVTFCDNCLRKKEEGSCVLVNN